mgnify:CR=1 FL=1|jgi:hypothetical protein
MTAVLQVATPEGDSGKILTRTGDYLFRYHDDAEAQAAISLLMPLRMDEYASKRRMWSRQSVHCAGPFLKIFG